MESNQYKAFRVKDYSYKERPQATSYIGKEQDTESNLADHGVRKYDSDLGRFLCPDALWEKYISYSPYQYAGNDPINKKDWNGKDFDLIVDDNSITIQASYTNFENNPNINAAINFFNSQSGRFQYVVGDKTFDINFNLGQFGLLDAPNNTTQILQDLPSNVSSGAGGILDPSDNIAVKDEYAANELVWMHEMGHSLGMEHYLGRVGIMSDEVRNLTPFLKIQNIIDIIKRTNLSIDKKTGDGLGEERLNQSVPDVIKGGTVIEKVD